MNPDSRYNPIENSMKQLLELEYEISKKNREIESIRRDYDTSINNNVHNGIIDTTVAERIFSNYQKLEDAKNEVSIMTKALIEHEKVIISYFKAVGDKVSQIAFLEKDGSRNKTIFTWTDKLTHT